LCLTFNPYLAVYINTTGMVHLQTEKYYYSNQHFSTKKRARYFGRDFSQIFFYNFLSFVLVTE
jgi:hypothetical protein